MSDRTEIVTFDFHGQPFRAIPLHGEPWFIAADAADILGYSAPSAMVRTLDPDEKGVQTVHTLGGDQQVSMITEPGLYSAILRSRVEGAKAFKRWVTHEVLPSIRRTGPASTHRPPQTFAEALRLAADQAERLETQQAEIHALEPRAAAADALVAVTGDYSLRGAAQVLSRDHGIDTGQNRLLKSLRELLWIDSHGTPYQRVIDAGWLTARIQTYDHPRTGEPTLARPQIRITPHGITRLHTLLATK